MTNDLRDSPPPLGTIPDLYTMLLGRYIRNRKELDAKATKEGREYFKNLLKGRRQVFDPLPPEKQVGWLAGTIDTFSTEILDSGGSAVLESLSKLDVATLAVLVEINQINLRRVEQRLFIRRAVAIVVATLGVLATLDKLGVLHSRIVTLIAAILGRELRWWEPLGILVAYALLVLMELVLWRPGKLRVEEFGQMLSVAFAYVSKLPSPKNDKGKEIKNDGEGGQAGEGGL